MSDEIVGDILYAGKVDFSKIMSRKLKYEVLLVSLTEWQVRLFLPFRIAFHLFKIAGYF